MRLINADEIPWQYGSEGDIVAYPETIDEMPTIEPERKGKWKGYNADDPNWLRTDGSPVFLICSECGQVVLNNISAHWNYCSNCGAKMEVEG